VAEFGEPAALLNNPNSQFTKMILAAASVNDQGDDSEARLEFLHSETKESSKMNEKLSLTEKRISRSESNDCNPVGEISDSSDPAESAQNDNNACQSNDSDEEPSDVTCLL